MSRQTSLGVAAVRQICKAFAISCQAYYAARKPKPAKPKAARQSTLPFATDEELEPKIREIVDKYPAWGVRKVRACLRREGVRVSHKRVWALTREWGLVLPPPAARDQDAPRGHVAVPESNRRWATDLTTVWTRQDGLVALVPTVDCGDRFCFEVAVTKSQESPYVLGPVERALVTAFNAPDCVPDGLELRTDHGPQYTGSDCEDLCDDWGLDHTLAPVGRPTGNAVVERFILTLKQKLIWAQDWESIDELRVAIRQWTREYNHERPHQSLDWRTPAEQRALNLKQPRQAAA